jgi:hypothetical protein
MHYFAYLDEFGHIGPFISRTDAKHSTSPVFGFAGIVLPVNEVRNFSMFFYKLKCRLLEWELHNKAKTPAYQWEKKGATLYTIKNIEEYEELRRATFRLINKIKACGGFIFYSGIEKESPSEEHSPEGLYLSVLRDSIRRIDSYCTNNEATFSMLLDSIDSDEPGARRKFRLEGIKVAGIEMFGSYRGYTSRALLEPPYQLESHLYQNLQCADWFCGLLGRYLAYSVLPEEYSDYKIVSDYFKSRLQSALKANSLRKNNQILLENEE